MGLALLLGVLPYFFTLLHVLGQSDSFLMEYLVLLGSFGLFLLDLHEMGATCCFSASSSSVAVLMCLRSSPILALS